MLGRKIVKRKRYCLEICNLKWFKLGKKDVGCQVKICFVELLFLKIIENVGIQIEILFVMFL